MKRILLAALILLAAAVAYAQQNSPPTSAQTRQEAQQYLNQARTNSNEFEANLADLRARNTSNDDFSTFFRLRREIDQLEATISSERFNIESRLDRGQRVSADVLNRFERMLDQHRTKMGELEVFLARN